nr:MAG TPA: hypothetical protein [Caudoviricetes sp.]
MKLYKFSEVKKSINPFGTRDVQGFKPAETANGAFLPLPSVTAKRL